MDRRLADRKLDALSAGCALFRPSQSCSAAILRVERTKLAPNSFLEGMKTRGTSNHSPRSSPW